MHLGRSDLSQSTSIEREQAIKSSFFEYNRTVRIENSKIACMLAVLPMPVGGPARPQDVKFFLLLRIGYPLCALWLLWSL